MKLSSPDKRLLQIVFAKAEEALDTDASRAANVFNHDKFTEATTLKRDVKRLKELMKHENII